MSASHVILNIMTKREKLLFLLERLQAERAVSHSVWVVAAGGADAKLW